MTRQRAPMTSPVRTPLDAADPGAVLDGLPHGVVVLDAEGRATAWNATALELLRRPAHTMPGARPPFSGPDVVLTPAGAPAGEPTPQALAGMARDRARRTLRRVAENGTERFVEATYSAAGGGAIACTLADVTPSSIAMRAMRADRDRAVATLDALGALVVVLTADGRVARANAGVCALLNTTASDLLGADFAEVAIPARERADARKALARLAAATPPALERFDASVRTLKGEERAVAWRATTLGASDVVLCGQDVTDHRQAAERLRFLSHHDRLTGLPNLGLLEEHLGLAVARARRQGTGLAVVRIDLDLDASDERVRDALVRIAALRLSETTRAGDVLARTGPEQLALMLADLREPATEAVQLAERALQDTLGAPLRLAGAELRLRPVAGVAVVPDHADNAGDLLRRSAAALEQARTDGGGAALADDTQPVSTGRPLSVAARLVHALERDELELHFQPVRAVDDGRLEGAEALVRWNDPERGLVGPPAFLPEAEEARLAGGIDAWVLDALCTYAREWAETAPLPLLSFNVAPSELRRPGLAMSILERVAAHGLEPRQLCVELPERGLAEHTERAARLAHDLRDAGFRVAIDDVGAAPSSLAHLRDLPGDVLKLDRSLLHGAPGDRRAAAVAAAILALSRALGATAVAKGVETQAQRAFLLAHDAPLAQGFLLGRPLLAAEMADLVRSG